MRIFILTCFTVLAFNALAQLPEIPNFSFENWTTINGNEYPDSWEVWDTAAVQAGAISKVNYATKGSYAIHLGSYSDNGTISGTTIEIRDTLISRVGGIAFDFRVQNNNSQMLNGLFMQLFYYDENGNYMNELNWSSPMFTNFDSYVVNDHNVPLPEDAKSYVLLLSYVNAYGSINEYAEVDNIRFLELPTGISEEENEGLVVYPNPAVNQITIDGIPMESIGNIRLTDIYGRSYRFDPEQTLDVSKLGAGLYLMEIIDKSGKPTNTMKIIVD